MTVQTSTTSHNANTTRKCSLHSPQHQHKPVTMPSSSMPALIPIPRYLSISTPKLSQHQRHQSHREVHTPSLYPGRLYAIANANCLQRVHQPSRIGEHSPYPSKCSLATSNANICVQLPAVSRAATIHPSPRTSIPLLLLAARTLFIHLSIPVLLSVWPFFTVP